VGHAAALCNQIFIVFDPDSAALAPDYQIIILSPLIGKLDIKAKFLMREEKVTGC
jgi:hypothetical protein